jgi:hypothetical protein
MHNGGCTHGDRRAEQRRDDADDPGAASELDHAPRLASAGRDERDGVNYGARCVAGTHGAGSMSHSGALNGQCGAEWETRSASLAGAGFQGAWLCLGLWV